MLPSFSQYRTHYKTVLTLAGILFLSYLQAQQITGVWKGKINKQRVEVKIVQNGDSLTGTSYYYASANSYSRYTIKGYFNPNTNSVIWWDDQLIEEKGGLFGTPGKTPQLSSADFNCPGGGEMYLDGKATPKEEKETEGPVDLTKVKGPVFRDEWDFVIDNYTIGANDPEIIDSVSLIATTAPDRKKPARRQAAPPLARSPIPGMVVIPAPRETKPAEKPQPKPVLSQPQTIEEKFIARRKVFTTDIPVTGDSIELRFYDNAEIDGDSISLFLNNKLLFEHIRLSDKAYTIKLPVADMGTTSELTMVAENLGSIPPNTSFMVALVGDKRYEAKLASTENSSAVIRFNKADSINTADQK
ncbi:MAG TPA: hypothetical protein VD794_03790 [Flavisolibacter sp.]|nr:hypothetical protein [Flavisolibacter sp.]